MISLNLDEIAAPLPATIEDKDPTGEIILETLFDLGVEPDGADERVRPMVIYRRAAQDALLGIVSWFNASNDGIGLAVLKITKLEEPMASGLAMACNLPRHGSAKKYAIVLGSLCSCAGFTPGQIKHAVAKFKSPKP